MKVKQALKVRDRLESKIRRIFIWAQDCKQSQSKITDRMRNEVWQDPEIEKAPRWVAEYLSGFRKGVEAHYLQLEFLYTIDDHLVSTTKGHELDMRKHGYDHEAICKHATMNGFYWEKTHELYFTG